MRRWGVRGARGENTIVLFVLLFAFGVVLSGRAAEAFSIAGVSQSFDFFQFLALPQLFEGQQAGPEATAHV